MQSLRKKTTLILIAFACTLIGLIIACFMRGWIIIQLPTQTTQQTKATAEQRSCSIWLYKNSAWHKEEVSCIWPHDTTNALQHLTQLWVALINEEKILTQPLQLTSALISDCSIGYLSFEQSPFSREQSTFSRWIVVESLLRTLRDNLPQLTSVMLLVNHKPLIDRHLDFSKPWPTHGFLETE